MKFQLWAKTVDKVWCYWEHLGETHQGGKILGKPLGNRLGTWWEHQNPKKLTPPPPPPFSSPYEKNIDSPACMLNHLIGCMKSLFLKQFVTIFDLANIPYPSEDHGSLLRTTKENFHFSVTYTTQFKLWTLLKSHFHLISQEFSVVS